MPNKNFCCINCGIVLDSIMQLAELCEKHPKGAFKGTHQLVHSELPYEDPNIFDCLLDSSPD